MKTNQEDLNTKNYGIYHVDFNDPNRRRTPKASAAFYRNLVIANGFEPYSDVMGGLPNDNDFMYGRFPEDFAWSTATASYQIEGGWNEGGIYVIIWGMHSQPSLYRHSIQRQNSL